jgi:hypothetical protein
MKSKVLILSSFKKDYLRTSGVIEATMYDDFILVFIDKSKLKSVLPSFYQGFLVSYFDLIEMEAATSNTIKHLTESKFDLASDEHKKSFNYLTKTNNLCKKLLQNELSPKT